MGTRETGGPAFPRPMSVNPNNGEVDYGDNGMSLRVYAAIELRVPDSGVDWLDAMIRRAERHEFAGMVLQGMLAYQADWEGMEEWAYERADRMLAAGEAR